MSAVPIRRSRLSASEDLFIEAYLESTDAESACVAAGIPVANAEAVLARPHIKRILEASEGFKPSGEMDIHSLAEEVLTVARDAAKAKSYAASVAGLRLYSEIKEKAKETGPPYDAEFEAQEIRKRLTGLMQR